MEKISNVLPRILPAPWKQTGEWGPNGLMFAKLNLIQRSWTLRVIASVEIPVKDTREWLHVSCSLCDRIPSYEQLQEVKEVFIGSNRKAIQIFPPKNEHVNMHPYTLHLYSCLDADPLPDFRLASGPTAGLI